VVRRIFITFKNVILKEGGGFEDGVGRLGKGKVWSGVGREGVFDGKENRS
jgi:hypothetical protein